MASSRLILLLALAAFVAVAVASNPGSLGPDPAKQLSGYITVPGFRNDNSTHLFYWFFEARNNPQKAPFVLWLTGGPGCSSLVALFFENGPYIIQNNLTLTLNPYSWTEVAHVLWIDQPVGTGFSYSEHPVEDTPQNEAQVAEDLYQFLQVFFQQNPQYNKQFYVFGESYAGHYIPALGARIVNGNKAPGKGVKIALAGLGIGNGWVDPIVQYGQYANLLHEAGLLDAVSTAAYNDVAYPTCKLLIEYGGWFAALEECSLAMEAVLADAELQNGRTINVYNVRERCEVEPLCYNFSIADSYLAQPSVRKALGVNPKVQWVDCAQGPHFALLDDWIGNFAVDVPTVLTAGIPVLVYSGTDDFVCNYLGGEAWVSQMSWPGQKTYNAAPWANWYDAPHQTQIGRAKTAQGLTFLEVFNAGHMVPMDQPVNSLQMLATFLAGRPFGKN